MKVIKVVLVAVSILVPLVVAALFVFTKNEEVVDSWVYQLPTLNATINSITILLLIAALLAIKKGHEQLHRNLMLSAMVLGAVFLLSYITYHASVPSTVYGDVDGNGVLSEVEEQAIGGMRNFYLVILLSHILFAVVGLPLVLTAAYLALTGKRSAHRKVVRFTYPVWMYIAITGVAVYFLISPYY